MTDVTPTNAAATEVPCDNIDAVFGSALPPNPDDPPESAVADDGEASPENANSPENGDSPEDTPEKRPPGLGPRWSYIITRGLVVAAVWGFFTYLFDPIVQQGLISAGQTAAGAKVELNEFETQFFPPRVLMTNVAVANADAPDTNLVEFAEFRGNISGMALMRGSYVIDEATVTGLTWNSARAESGTLDEQPPEEEVPEDSGPGKLEEIGKQWADDLFQRAKLEYDPRNLETARLAQQLEVEWKQDFDGLEGRAKTVEAQVKQLEQLYKQARGGNPLRKFEQYQVLTEGVARLVKEVESIKQDAQVLRRKAPKDLADLDAARKRDQAQIRQKIENLTLNGDELSEFLLGPTLYNRLDQALSWLRWADDRADDFSRSPKPVRERGEDVVFPIPNELPKYLVRLVNVSGQGVVGDQQLAIEGTMTNVTSDPRKLGKPTIMRMSGRGEADVELKAVIDRTTDQRIVDLDLESLYDRATETSLGDDDSLAIDARADSTRWHVQLRTIDDQLQGRIILTQAPATLTPRLPEKADDSLKRVVAASMQNIDRIDATVELSGTIRKPQFDLATNLGPVISDGIQQGVRQEVSAQSDALMARLNLDFQQQQGSLIKMFNGRYAGLSSKLTDETSTLQKLIPQVAGKAFDPTRLFR